ncbi:hypothetical protein ESA_02028 [Cronobacter sakazakii ATCC BAA-894]|uniref:Uncharacterized protein n=1 Tax=Cronobacter sakazakii (strain ATCC BAA-894) TaxID=290339 RepID=A7MFC4_CROS8|nr:hypothetical protein ESA_02028 [Cronobacter sakazakii ATCC BAA-894]
MPRVNPDAAPWAAFFYPSEACLPNTPITLSAFCANTRQSREK